MQEWSGWRCPGTVCLETQWTQRHAWSPTERVTHLHTHTHLSFSHRNTTLSLKQQFANSPPLFFHTELSSSTLKTNRCVIHKENRRCGSYRGVTVTSWWWRVCVFKVFPRCPPVNLNMNLLTVYCHMDAVIMCSAVAAGDWKNWGGQEENQSTVSCYFIQVNYLSLLSYIQWKLSNKTMTYKSSLKNILLNGRRLLLLAGVWTTQSVNMGRCVQGRLIMYSG